MKPIPEISQIIRAIALVFERPFTGRDIKRNLKKYHPKIFKTLVDRYGYGGHDCGRQYTINNFIGRLLANVEKEGALEGRWVQAPPGWGSSIIRQYRSA